MKRNKIVKVTYMGRKQSGMDLHRTKWGRFCYKVKLWFRGLVAVSALGGTVYGLLIFGGMLFPTVHFQTVEAIKEVERDAPIMERIADCETGDRTPSGKAVKGTARHFGKSGQVIMTGNTNKSVDVGKYAINSVWFKMATEKGWDLTQEEDNKAMAYHIYTTRGTGDWYSSQTCWK